MKKNWLLICLYMILVQAGFAQGGNLQVKGSSPDLYLTHTVQAKENLYSIGRLYNVNPKQLAPYNSLSVDKALAIGQTLKVPLTAENFSQDGSKSADEVFVPVHHTIQEKEWLYRVSVNYNKVPVETLEKWNNINKDQAKAGVNLVIGYLKVKTNQSALAANANTKIARTNPVPVNMPEEKPGTVKEDKKPAPLPAQPEKIDPTTIRGNTPVQQEPKEETKPVVTSPVVTNTPGSAKGGYFKTQYGETGKSISGSAGTFKSTSGWNDGKFYALVNNVPVGTIVRVNNPVSGRAVFAKVLGSLPDMKESLGLVARLSDAAAAELDADGLKFSVELKY
jgi:LysM repeat protein